MLVTPLLSGSASIWAQNVDYTTWRPHTGQDILLNILSLVRWESHMNRYVACRPIPTLTDMFNIHLCLLFIVNYKHMQLYYVHMT